MAVATASLDVRISGPAQAAVGSQATFQITVTNLGQAPATGLVIKDRLDRGFGTRGVRPAEHHQAGAGRLGRGRVAARQPDAPRDEGRPAVPDRRSDRAEHRAGQRPGVRDGRRRAAPSSRNRKPGRPRRR